MMSKKYYHSSPIFALNCKKWKQTIVTGMKLYYSNKQKHSFMLR